MASITLTNGHVEALLLGHAILAQDDNGESQTIHPSWIGAGQMERLGRGEKVMIHANQRTYYLHREGPAAAVPPCRCRKVCGDADDPDARITRCRGLRAPGSAKPRPILAVAGKPQPAWGTPDPVGPRTPVEEDRTPREDWLKRAEPLPLPPGGWPTQPRARQVAQALEWEKIKEERLRAREHEEARCALEGHDMVYDAAMEESECRRCGATTA